MSKLTGVRIPSNTIYLPLSHHLNTHRAPSILWAYFWVRMNMFINMEVQWEQSTTQHDISIVPLNILLHLKINAFFSHFIHLFHFSSIFVASLTWWCLLSSATSTALCHVQKETWPLTCRYLSPRCSDSIQRIRFSRVCVCVYVLHWTHFHLLTCLVLFLLCKCSQVLLRRIGDMPCAWVSHVGLYVRSWQAGWLKIFLSVL